MWITCRGAACCALTSRRAFHAPAWARVFAPPPPKTATTLMNAERGTRNAEHQRERRAAGRPSTSVPPSAFRVPTSLPRPRIIPAIHDPTGSPFRRPVIPPLLVRRLRHDRRHVRGHALLVERHVRHVAR